MELLVMGWGVRRSKGLRRAVVLAAVLAAIAAPPARASVVAPASPPPRPPAGTPGGDGPCATATRIVPNPRQPALPVHVFTPGGSDRALVGGGRCNDGTRPVVIVAHGYGQTDPAAYGALVRHLVSVGNVVIYPTYDAGDGSRPALEESYRLVDAGAVAGVAATPSADPRRIGWWGHSHGGGMVPWLVQQGAARRWGSSGLWMMNVAQAYSQLVGAAGIPVPRRTRALTVAFEQDAFADNRLGIDVFESLRLPSEQKRHVTVQTDVHGQPALVADHGAPASGEADANAIDFLLWRYVDVLETCALTGKGCATDLSEVGSWSDGTPVVRAVVTKRPVDSGVVPAVLAECDAVHGPNLNPRIERCGASHV